MQFYKHIVVKGDPLKLIAVIIFITAAMIPLSDPQDPVCWCFLIEGMGH